MQPACHSVASTTSAMRWPVHQVQPPCTVRQAQPPIPTLGQSDLGPPNPPSATSGPVYPGPLRPWIGNPTSLWPQFICQPTAPCMFLLGDISIMELHIQQHVLCTPSLVIHTCKRRELDTTLDMAPCKPGTLTQIEHDRVVYSMQPNQGQHLCQTVFQVIRHHANTQHAIRIAIKIWRTLKPSKKVCKCFLNPSPKILTHAQMFSTQH